jgi:hypothetical protein
MIIHFYEDPGHGWAKVPRALLVKLEIENAISTYSFERGGQVYLEEDRDMGILLRALQARNIHYTFKDHMALERRSKIRNYNHYRSA